MPVPDKIRIKKRQKPKIEEWCKALEVPESRFIEDAIDVYIKILDGKYPDVPSFSISTPASTPGIFNPQMIPDNIEDIEDPEDYDGGIDL